MIYGRVLNVLYSLNLDLLFIDLKSDVSMYMLDFVKFFLFGVCSIYKIIGIEYFLNLFLS